jgi:phosphoribosyl-ATP pyrophosphohydrolase
MTDFISTLFTIIQDRQQNPQTGSYTNSLFVEGENKIVQKIGEEAIEIIVAVKGQTDERIIEESADLIYHLLVMLAYRGLTWDDVQAELEKRHGS